jgi:hypothetical protein
MRKETFTLGQKELQRVSAISLCIKGKLAVVQLARSNYVGFNDHHLCEKLTESKAFRSVAKRFVVCGAKKTSAHRANAAPRLIASVVNASLVKVNWCSWTAARTIGWKAAAPRESSGHSLLAFSRIFGEEQVWRLLTLVSGAPSAAGRRSAGARGCRAGASRKSSLGVFIRVRGARVDARGRDGFLSHGYRIEQAALERRKPEPR